MEANRTRNRPELLLGAAALLIASAMMLFLGARGSFARQAPTQAPTTLVLAASQGQESSIPSGAASTEDTLPASYAVGYTGVAVYQQQGGTGAGAQQTASPGPVNINTATQAQLETLPGIGPAKAQAILAWRGEHGAFSDPAQLLEIPGIGEKTLMTLLPFLTIG